MESPGQFSAENNTPASHLGVVGGVKLVGPRILEVEIIVDVDEPINA
jgi:hypothetical protein